PARYFRNEVDRATPRRRSDRGLPFLSLSRCCALLRRRHAHHRRDQLLVCVRHWPYPCWTASSAVRPSGIFARRNELLSSRAAVFSGTKPHFRVTSGPSPVTYPPS